MAFLSLEKVSGKLRDAIAFYALGRRHECRGRVDPRVLFFCLGFHTRSALLSNIDKICLDQVSPLARAIYLQKLDFVEENWVSYVSHKTSEP